MISFNNLTIEFCKKHNASVIIRGLRAVSDFEYEFQLAGMNKKLNSKIETMFLMSDVENQIISSKFVKEIANLDGDILTDLLQNMQQKCSKININEKNILFINHFF